MKISLRAFLVATCVLVLSSDLAHAQAEKDGTFEAATDSIPPKPPNPVAEVVAEENLADQDEVLVELPPTSGNTLQLSVNLYGNMGALFTSDGDGERSAFALGRAVVIFGAEVGEQVRALGELTFKATDGGGNVERLYLTWSNGSYFVAGGRMHADIGYWNTAYHHGLWLQLPIGRPAVLSFGGGLLPVHVIGMRAGFDLPVGDGSLRVLGAISNGRGDEQGDVPVASDNNQFKSLLLSVTYRGLGLPDLTASAGVSYDHIAPEDGTVRSALPNVRIQEVIANAYLTYTGELLTVIAEAFVVSHYANSASWQTWDAFALVGYKFGDFVPYVMLEGQVVPAGMPDPYFVPDALATSRPFDFVQSTLGVRYRLGGNNTLKLEYRLRHPIDAGEDAHVVAIDWAFGI